jgi:hypothetical protein
MPVLTDKIPGGKADGKDLSKYDQKQLLKGILVEFEHTDDVETALEIATDHLEEFSDYYDGLEQMEEKLKISAEINLETGEGLVDVLESEILQYAPPELVQQLREEYGDLNKLSQEEIIDLLDGLLDRSLQSSVNVFNRVYNKPSTKF